MLTQRLIGDYGANTGTLTITCSQGDLEELMALADDLQSRSNMVTNGPIFTGVPAPPVVEE
jgi:hypothetical protein